MIKDTIKKIESLQNNISFLGLAEKNNSNLDKIFCHYEDILENKDNKNIIKKCLEVINSEVWKLDYKDNIYHNAIKNDILLVNSYIVNN